MQQQRAHHSNMHRIFILLADHVTPVIFIGGGSFFGLFVMLFLVAVGTEICFILLFRLICGLLLHFNTYSILHYQYIHWNFQYKPPFLQCIVFLTKLFRRKLQKQQCKVLGDGMFFFHWIQEFLQWYSIWVKSHLFNGTEVFHYVLPEAFRHQ